MGRLIVRRSYREALLSEILLNSGQGIKINRLNSRRDDVKVIPPFLLGRSIQGENSFNNFRERKVRSVKYIVA